MHATQTPFTAIDAHVRPGTRVTVQRAVVPDPFDADSRAFAARAAFAAMDAQLQRHPTWKAPTVIDGVLHTHNPVSRRIYGSSAAMVEWRRDLVPSARALYNAQRPHDTHFPSGAAHDDVSRAWFHYSLDSIAIRSRAVVVADAARRASERTSARDIVAPDARPRSGEHRPAWVSLACGAAVPVLDALAGISATTAPGQASPHLWLVDIDQTALDFGRGLAAEQGLVEGTDYTVLAEDLVRVIVNRTPLVDRIGERTATVVDAVGIFEYFRDVACERLLRHAYRLVRPGGALVVANMLSDRRELALNQRGWGWPHIIPRSLDDLIGLVERSGLPLHHTTITIPTDGVYAVIEISA